ncbi:2-phosphosulfolactate phosphatase [Amycolatopsis anabasis]|uniref:2-phosphosulfolactate phosphatase n=1 Tax=Amycolatopsis anabasis TaxID=1840409 RepID=UPI001FEAB877|nr:2-phosphosulfolactate phosphatase [Amycolatopsis anabasis]
MRRVFGQPGSDVRLEWCPEGGAALGAECGVLVVVDVLSFGTTVDVVLGRGGRVLPLRWRDSRAVEAAERAGAVLADRTQWTLRPSSVATIPAGERWGVDVLGDHGDGGALRPCVEDQLGAGAVVDALLAAGAGEPSAEAALAATAYRASDPVRALTECASGRELAAAGHAGDVELARAVNVSPVAPLLIDGVLG